MNTLLSSSDRYCGVALNCLRFATTVGPIYTDSFHISFNTDDQDDTTGATLNQNRGFSLNYLQLPC